MKRNSLLVILFSLVLTACAAPTPTAAPSASTSAVDASPSPTIPSTETQSPTETPIPVPPTEVLPKEGDWKIEQLPNGDDVKVYWFDLKDADGNSIGLKRFYNLTRGYPFYWNDFIQAFPVNAWLEFHSNGDNPIQAIEITPKRNLNGATEFDSYAVGKLERRIEKDSGVSKGNYIPGLLDEKIDSSFFKYTIGKNEYTLAPNQKTGMDVFILHYDPNLVDAHGFVPATANGKYNLWTANWGNTEADESVRTAFVSETPVGELPDSVWLEFLLANATSLFTQTDQTKPFTSTSGDFVRFILNDKNSFVRIIRVSPSTSPTPTP